MAPAEAGSSSRTGISVRRRSASQLLFILREGYELCSSAAVVSIRSAIPTGPEPGRWRRREKWKRDKNKLRAR